MILAQYFHYQINSTLYPSLANFRHAIKFIMYDVHCTSQLKFPFCYKIHSRECAECYLHCQKMINGKESSPYLSFCSTKPNTVDTNDLRQRTSPQAKRHEPSLFPWQFSSLWYYSLLWPSMWFAATTISNNMVWCTTLTSSSIFSSVFLSTSSSSHILVHFLVHYHLHY